MDSGFQKTEWLVVFRCLLSSAVGSMEDSALPKYTHSQALGTQDSE